MDKRQQRGFEIARQKQVKPTKEGWLVKSQSASGFYHVQEDFNCNCPDAEFHKETCKHAYAVRFFLKTEMQTPEGVKVVEKRITYPQAWAAYTAAQTSEVRLFDELLQDLVEGVAELPQQRGRPRTALNTALFCCIQKVYSQLSSRRAASLYGNAKEKGQIRKTPNYNVINLYLNKPELTPILQGFIAATALPLKALETDWAVDSTGFRTRCFGAYAEQKYGLQRNHRWLKAHAITGTLTNVIAGVEITDELGADSPQFAPLVESVVANGFSISEVSADKAYSSRANYDTVQEAGGIAYIPFKSNATGRTRGSRLWNKMFHYFQLNQEEFLSHYHKRSNVESTFAAIKKKFGETLKSKNPTAQRNELLCKIVAYNITVLIHAMHELGIQPDFCSKSPSGAKEAC